MRRFLFPWMVGVLLCAAATPSLAQQGTAEIGGKVADQQGAVLPGVAIVVTNVDSGVFREAVSGADGSYFASQLVPGRYRVSAKLAGFQSFERSGLVLQVGKTLTINISLGVGGIEETVSVTAESPLVDTTSAKVGGNIGTQEISELPAMNRNFFSTVALLPGVQFSPSNQMGNDTIVAAGQSTQGNNVAVDGGYNSDDALGTSSGAQVRTPLEAVQEFQVITSMYDAEWGRASGAIVNAVTKSGTNQFKGVIFGEMASNALTSEDYFVRTQNLTKPTSVRRDWGGVIGGPIVKNKAHFFFSLERQVDNPNRTRVFPTKPSLNFSIAEDRTDWNTLIRFDHQINANNTWAVRWLREWAPQWYTIGTRQTLDSYQDETDLDQTAVGTLTSVLGNSRVNTVRLARTWEHWWHGNSCFRAQGPNGNRAGFDFGNETSRQSSPLSAATQQHELSYRGQHRVAGPVGLQLSDRGRLFVVPAREAGGPRHEVRDPLQLHHTSTRVPGQRKRDVLVQYGPAVRCGQSEDLPRAVFDSDGLAVRGERQEPYVRSVRPGQMAGGPRTTINVGVRYDLEIIPLDETGNPLFPAGGKAPTDWNNVAPRISFTHSMDESGKSVIRGGYGIFYNRTILGAVDDTLEFGKYTTSSVVTFPTNSADPGPSAGRFPTNPYLVNGPTVNRALLNASYPPGVAVKNDGVVVFDTPTRSMPYAHQFTLGFVRELAPSLALHADYIRAVNKDMFLARNLNPALRVDTSRTGALTRSDAFGVLGESYASQVWVMENTGDATYDALNLSLEKRYSNNWSGRISYSLSKATGTGNDQADRNTYQVGTNLNLDAFRGPSNVDRRHILSVGAQMEIPKTGGVTLAPTMRYMSGAPFSIYDSSIDADRNGELVDPVPAGSYSGTATDSMKDVKNNGGRNGAIGPDYFQIDVRAGWRRKLRAERALEVFLDIYNLTNRANFDNPTVANSDRRLPATFLVLTNLRGGGGFPRQASMGIRMVF